LVERDDLGLTVCCVPCATTVGDFIAKLHAPAGQAPELRCEPMAAARVHPLFSGMLTEARPGT